MSEAFLARAPKRAQNSVSDQQVRAIDVGKSNVDIGIVYREGVQAADSAVAEHDQVSEVYHVIDGSATLMTGSDIVGWEQIGVAAVRLGDWKAVFLPPPRGPGEWELYEVSKDPGETKNLATSRPEKLVEMVGHYETYFQETGMFDSYALYQSALQRLGWPKTS